MELNATITLAAADLTSRDGDSNVCSHGLDCLPILRWSNTIGGLTSRVDDVSMFNPRSWFEAVPANITGIFLSIGNNLWAAAATIERMADGSSAMTDTFGKMANRFTGAVWNSLSDWRILSVAIILVVGVSLWRYIHNGTVQAFGQRMVALVLGLAMFSTVGIASANNPETPATLTPYWMVNTTSKYIGDVAGSASDALVQGFDSGGTFLAHDYSKNATGDLLSCRNYLHQLHLENSTHMKSNGHANDTVLTAMNTMWEETALRIYARTQYGPGVNADQVFCRVPEYRAGATADDIALITKYAISNAYDDKQPAGHFSADGDMMAYIPNLWEGAIGTKADQKVANEDVGLDRWVTMWDVCGFGKQRNSLYIRSGWAFVNSVEGDNRGIDSSGNPASDTTDLLTQCRASLTASLTKSKNGEYNKADGKLRPSVMMAGAAEDMDAANKACSNMIGSTLSGAATGGFIGAAWGAAKKAASCLTTNSKAEEHFSTFAALANKFNLSSSENWRTLATLHNNTTDETVINSAIRTLSYQQGKVTASELGASVVFSLSSIVNLLIWGVGFGLIKMLTLALACLVAAGGLWLGLLFYALSPDKGKRAVVNAAKRVGGMCAAGSVLGLVASTGCLFVTAAMAGLGLINGQGSTTGNTTLFAVASAVLPFVYLWAIRYICVNVWRIGDPFSGEGLFRMIGGQAIMGGLKTLGGAALGGAAGAIGAAMGGGGVKDMLGAAAHGAGLDRSHGALGRAVGTAMAAKDHTEMRNAMLGRNKDNRPGSDADKAALDRDGKPLDGEGSKEAEKAAGGDGTKDGRAQTEEAVRDRFRKELEAKGLKGEELEKALDERMASDEGRKAVDDLKYGSKPSDDERTQAEKAVRDRFRKELEAKGLKGDRLESALDGRMRSTEGMEAVSALADKLHDEAGITDAERDAARRAVFGKRSRELQKAGFKGGDLKRELDKYMDSDEAKAAVDDLARFNHEQRVYGDDIRRAEDAKRARLRESLAAQGLSGRRLDDQVEAMMASDPVRMEIMRNAHAAHASSALASMGFGTPTPTEADHIAAYKPDTAELAQAQKRIRERVTNEERARLSRTMDANSPDFQSTLEANVDSIMRANGTGKEIGDLASEIHHDNYMAAMDRRVAALGPDARAVLDRRMAAERERIMAGHPDLSIAEARARARGNVLTESGMASIQAAGERHALAGMASSLNGNANDMIAAASRLGVAATQAQMDDATDMVRQRLTQQAAAQGLSGTLLDSRVDSMMASDTGRAAVRAQALSMNPQVAAQAADARARAVDQATVSLMRTGAYADTADARAAAIAQNRLATRYVSQGLSGDELNAKVASMMADPTVKARMKADADVLRADPRRTARFDGMLAETNSTLRGRFETARMSGSGNLGAAKAAVMGSRSVQTAGAVASAVGATAGAVARTAAAHPVAMAAATAALAPIDLPATAMAATAALASHTLAGPNGHVRKAVGFAKPAARKAVAAARENMTPLNDGDAMLAVAVPAVADPMADMPTMIPRPAPTPAAAPDGRPPAFVRPSDRPMPAADPTTRDGARVIDEAYGPGTAAVMDDEGLASPDTAVRLNRGQAVLPQPRSGYTDEAAGYNAAHGAEDSVYAPAPRGGLETRAVPAPAPAEALAAVSSTPAVKAAVEAYAQTTGMDTATAVHFDKHPADSLRSMGIDVADDREAARVASALGRLGVTGGGDAVADAAQAIHDAGGADAEAALGFIRGAMPRSTPARPAPTVAAPQAPRRAASSSAPAAMPPHPVETPSAAQSPASTIEATPSAPRSGSASRGRHDGASYAKARSDAARRGGDGSERPAMASADKATAMRADMDAAATPKTAHDGPSRPAGGESAPHEGPAADK
ncbi:hypothetical protein GA752_10190 [Bifidobacterium adolescentis]|uniref:Uncharacterized protein n=1 Tax=Bifidobacterium adolescentis TaxID=1680 RepID=A0A7J5MVX6_BIFAD|nr:hypothetical protein GA752_10190 [Bifidobacterium adolescentis]KAB5747370.1 hypothetical protein GA831_10010 [Bifidobacterium adolescentis]